MVMENNQLLKTAAAERDDGSGRRMLSRNYSLLLLQLIMIAVLVQRFEIEQHRHFFPVLCFAIAGFAVHFWLPARHRLSGFALLSAGSVLFLLGVSHGLTVLTGVAACIGVICIPVRETFRLLILLTIGVVLVLLRDGAPSSVWPVLGSMLMFRLFLIYCETRHQTTRPGLALTVSYFLMLPNVCFPFFPVVDYQTFQRSFRGTREWTLYEQGISWMLRGIIQLLLYRLLRIHGVSDLNQLRNLGEILLFLISNYGLYLQVSGQFHLITGMLHLFGFSLPRTHDHYFLASSFSDIWKRINIYWKDFMSKYFFFPVFFRLRSRGLTVNHAVTLSIFWVFFCTWILHSWQTFWLLGRFPIAVSDAVLWGIAGFCVAVESSIQSPRSGSANSVAAGWATSFRRSAQSVGMFLLISVFWAFWTKPDFLSVSADILSAPDAWQGTGVVIFGGLIAVLLGTIVIEIQRKRSVSKQSNGLVEVASERSFPETAALHLAAIGFFLAAHSLIITTFPNSSAAGFLTTMQSAPVVSPDAIAGGYYEDLNAASIQAGPLLESFVEDPEEQRKQAQGFEKVSRPADMYQVLELIPGIVTELDGSRTSVNQFGMRDRSTLTLTKPENTKRVAVVGSSIVMGYGVNDDEVFTRLLETRLNHAASPEISERVEVLNFGVGKLHATHRLVRIQRQVVRFSPDLLIYVAHQDELSEVAGHIAALISAQLKLPSARIDDVAKKSGVRPDMSAGEIYSRLLASQSDLLGAVYQGITDECHRHSIRPVWIYLPIPDPNSAEVGNRVRPLADSAGFLTFDATDWHQSQDGLFRSAQDYHPTAKGHRLIAESLDTILRKNSLLVPRKADE